MRSFRPIAAAATAGAQHRRQVSLTAANYVKSIITARVSIVNCIPVPSVSVYISHVPFFLHCRETENLNCLFLACGQLLYSPQRNQTRTVPGTALWISICTITKRFRFGFKQRTDTSIGSHELQTSLNTGPTHKEKYIT